MRSEFQQGVNPIAVVVLPLLTVLCIKVANVIKIRFDAEISLRKRNVCRQWHKAKHDNDNVGLQLTR